MGWTDFHIEVSMVDEKEKPMMYKCTFGNPEMTTFCSSLDGVLRFLKNVYEDSDMVFFAVDSKG